MQLPTLMIFAYRNVSTATFMSTLHVTGYRIVVVPGEALIERGRSIAATQWLNEAKHSDVCVMTDDDFYFTAPGLDSLVSLCRETRGIVAGVTPLRSGEYTAIVPLDSSLEEPWINPLAKPQRIRWAGGLIAYHRSVFDRLAATLPLLHDNVDTVPAFYPFFHTTILDHPTDGKILLSEDYACHERAQALGIPIWVQPACQVGHISEVVLTPDKMNKMREVLV